MDSLGSTTQPTYRDTDMARIATNHRVNSTICTVLFQNAPKSLRSGIMDKAGREVTAECTLGKCEAIEGPGEKWGTSSGLPAGTHYWASVQIGRDGYAFGGGSDTAYFPTAEERDAYIEKRFDTIIANAEKNAK